MKKEDLDNELNEKELEADNFTEDTPNEQSVEEKAEESEDSTDKLASELAALKDTHLRLMAEYDNYRRRTLKEKAELIKNGGEQVLTGILPVIDDFERAIDHIKPVDEVSEAIAEGVVLIYNKLLSYLNQNGVKAIETKEQDFNADLMDAVATIPAPDESLKGKVVDCVQKGYTLNEKVIRHAKVVVGE